MQLRIRLNAFAALLLAGHAGAQCLTATVESYDCAAPNPIELTTSFPHQYPVLCDSLLVEAVGAEPGSFGALWLSCSPACIPLTLPNEGDLLIDPFCSASFPYAGIPSWQFNVPCGFPAGFHLWLQSVHSKAGGGFELSNGLEIVTGFYQAEIGVTSVVPPDDLVCGVGPRDYVVTLHNSGNAPARADVTVSVGVGLGSTFATATLGPVPPFGDFTGTVSVLTPVCSFVCGGSFAYTVTASSHFADCDASNDNVSTTAILASAYWDLDFDIIGAPSTGQRCGFVNWKVRVTNRGNIPSANVCALTAINCSPGSRNFSCNLGKVFFTTPNIAPGGSWVYAVNGYAIACGAFQGTQYIKAEIDYLFCDDDCNPGNNNYAEKAIFIQ